MARTMGTWLSGPGPFDSGDGADADARSKYPGERLGLPENGPGSLARMGRRVGALFVDWLVAYGLAGLAMALGLVSMPMLSTAVLVIWMVLGTVAVRLFSFTPGQLALGLVVVPADGRDRIGIVRAFLRVVLIALVIPPLVSDSDLRGLHDRVTFTAVVRR
ncbi:putative RDD family membrane protein YckC [Mycobacterium frederiksbergense]|uniref:RDD family membrane protein YckC n=1 Tax=Mycolicibacterium frederiksbergense TaxID=117567 RepID=A0ABT6KWC1_9MYCO|nr:RDD family protein [Mycolicibacterium frederiksbergense]MDH6195011.1 putative RDD family membrane protein YckC [Mycolicibacterium frederiksbergense]